MKKHPRDTDLDFLHDCTKEELEFLVRLIIDAGGKTNGLQGKAEYEMNRSDPTKYVNAIIEEIQLYAGDTMMNRIRGYGVSYRTALQDTLDDLDVRYDKRLPLPELEDLLIRLGVPEFLKHIRDKDVRDILRTFWENPSGGTCLNGDLGYSNLWKECKDALKSLIHLKNTGEQQWHPFPALRFFTAPAKRVVIPAVIHISFLRKWKHNQTKGQ